MGKHYSKTTKDGISLWKCNYCDYTTDYGPANLSIMRNHLAEQHSDIFQNISETDLADDSSTSEGQSETLAESGQEPSPQISEHKPRIKPFVPKQVQPPSSQSETIETRLLREGESALDDLLFEKVKELITKMKVPTAQFIIETIELDKSMLRDSSKTYAMLFQCGLKENQVYIILNHLNALIEKYKQYISPPQIISNPAIGSQATQSFQLPNPLWQPQSRQIDFNRHLHIPSTPQQHYNPDTDRLNYRISMLENNIQQITNIISELGRKLVDMQKPQQNSINDKLFEILITKLINQGQDSNIAELQKEVREIKSSIEENRINAIFEQMSEIKSAFQSEVAKLNEKIQEIKTDAVPYQPPSGEDLPAQARIAIEDIRHSTDIIKHSTDKAVEVVDNYLQHKSKVPKSYKPKIKYDESELNNLESEITNKSTES